MKLAISRRQRRLSLVLTAIPLALLLLVPLGATAASPGGAEGQGNAPKNVIVMVVDGMGYNYVDMASLYAHGRSRYQIEGEPGDVRRVPSSRNPTWAYERFPHQFAMSTHTAINDYDPEANWGDFDQMVAIEGDNTTGTGSAAAATSMSTGVKTIDPYIGLDALGNPVKHAAQRAMELGKAAGVITDVPYIHATPAGFALHDPSRTNYQALSRQMVFESELNVIMGTGHPFFTDDGVRRSARFFWTPQDVWNALNNGETPYTFVEERDDFLQLGKDADPPTHVMGIAQSYNATQFNRFPTPLNRSFRLGPPGRVDPDEEPFTVPFNDNVPTLAEMSVAGLNVLANASDEGFYVMIEGGSPDWAGHWNLAGRLVEEMLFFNEAVDAVVDWIQRESSWSETLLIVTSDHEAGYLSGPGSNPNWTPLQNNGPGNMPGYEWHHVYHTNQLVPLFAKGAGAQRFRHYVYGEDPVWGPYVDNTAVALVVFDFWGRD